MLLIALLQKKKKTNVHPKTANPHAVTIRNLKFIDFLVLTTTVSSTVIEKRAVIRVRNSESDPL